jgi:hypothetical protein
MPSITALLLAGALIPAGVAAQTFKPSTNPVADAMRELIARHSKHLIASAELMPADKYGYQPTPAQMTFRQLIAHIALTNVALCSGISGAPTPKGPDELKQLASVESKDVLVAAIKQSFDYCTDALANATDAQLAEQASMFGRPAGMSRASVMITLAVDWADHYSTAASYLRLNDILPPSAQPKK